MILEAAVRFGSYQLRRTARAWGTALLVTFGVAAGASVASAAPGDWQTYQNEPAGYRVDYPADWTVRELADANGVLSTAFRPAGRGACITLTVPLHGPDGPAEAVSDIPNTYCRQVSVGGLDGTTCLDTLSMSRSTVLIGQDRTYTIATFGKRLDHGVYQRFLEGFSITS